MVKFVKDNTFPQYPRAITYLIDEEKGEVTCRIEKHFAVQHLMLSDKHFSDLEINNAYFNGLVYKFLVENNNEKYIIGVAKCNRDLDTFDETKGKMLAYDKAMLTVSKVAINVYNDSIEKFEKMIEHFNKEKERKVNDLELFERRIENFKVIDKE